MTKLELDAILELDAADPGSEIYVHGFSFPGCQMRKFKNGKWARLSDNGRPISRESMTSDMVLRVGIVSEGPK